MELSHSEAGHRFEAVLGDRVVGYVAYTMKDGRCAMMHTVVPPEFSGQGIAGKVVAYALDLARNHGWAVLPYCPYISAFISKHPEYRDLVPDEERWSSLRA